MPKKTVRSRNLSTAETKPSSGSSGSTGTASTVNSDHTEKVVGNSKPTSGRSLRKLPESDEKPSSKPQNSYILIIYSKLFGLREYLRSHNLKFAVTRDKFLASIGYPARLLGYLLNASKLSALSSLISDWRTFARVVTTPATLQWSLDLLLNNSNPDTLDRFGDYIQAIAGSVYQILEDIAYFSGKSVIYIKKSTQAKLWAISSRFWAVHVAIELLRVPYHYYYLRKPVNLRNLVVNLAWAPLTLHWSTPHGLVNDGWVGFLGTVACWPNLVYQWKMASV